MTAWYVILGYAGIACIVVALAVWIGDDWVARKGRRVEDEM